MYSREEDVSMTRMVTANSVVMCAFSYTPTPRGVSGAVVFTPNNNALVLALSEDGLVCLLCQRKYMWWQLHN